MRSPSPPPSYDPEADWVRRARAGDSAAFDALARRYRAALLAQAFLRTGHLDEAEDLVQDVLATAWRKLSTLQDPDAFVPWIKAIAANACINWHHRSRNGRVTRLEADEGRSHADPGPLPLDLALRRERQRELHAALLRLPETNRTALMMHVWGGYSYGEIAAFAGVQVTTVEGRIFRAKRQLRRLLLDRDTEFLGNSSAEKTTKKGRRMKDEGRIVKDEGRRVKDEGQGKAGSASGEREVALAQPLALAMFTRRFSAMIDSGIGLVSCLKALHEVPPPYGEAARRIQAKIEQGYTLSRTMKEEPDLFSGPYVALIRAGEVGGCLEETMQRAAQLLTQEWELARHRPESDEPLFISLPASAPQVEAWTGLTSYQQSVTVILFCEIMSMLLMSGEPVPKVLEIATAVLPPRQRGEMDNVRGAAEKGKPMTPILESMNIFPQFVTRMIGIGEEGGHLDRTLHSAAETLRQELES